MKTTEDNPAPGPAKEAKKPPKSTVESQAKGDTRTAEQKAISAEILTLTSEFNRFSSDCAFLCEAFAATASDQSNMDDYIVYGFNRYSLWIKEQVLDFDERIQKLQEHIREQHWQAPE
ncbi:hypothetical protein [Thalassomonas haliotis]|uniref:DUF3144 domain-containing protein n=1 Tax=Thalassomonas haliotis TaxID=485448 RepID=A0ABY7VBE6_9GAMM|nr:hypothetical protein [Thalassomonas haliotis]WDE10626.1 hypothetical protein H3N35_20555 [Thalassomonas haliotis]